MASRLPRLARALTALAVLAGLVALAPAAGAACTGSNGRDLPGGGSVSDPFLVGSALDLAAVGNGGCGLDAAYRQIADISLPAAATAPGALASNFTPISFTSFSGFFGTYDGGGHRITGLVYDDRAGTPAGNVGLFSLVSGGAVIRDVHLRDVRIRGAQNVGGLIGIVDVSAGGGTARIEDVSVTGTVMGAGKVGGVVGTATVAGTGAEIQILRATSEAVVQATPTSVPYWSEAGGLIGAAQASGSGRLTIDEVRATGTVAGVSPTAGVLAEQVGGLIGSLGVAAGSGPSTTVDVVLSDALATGAVSARQVAGGLIGYIGLDTATRALRLERVGATGHVTAGANAGGLIGVAYAFGSGPGTIGQGVLEIVDAYAGGDVVEEAGSPDTTFGGLIGVALYISADSGGSLELERVYARGAVPTGGKGLVGELAMGRVVPLDPTGFWNGQTTGAASSGFDNAWTASTTAQMTTIGLYATAATPWPIVPLWQAPAAGRTWGICASVNDGYPFLLMQHDAMPCAAPAAPTGLSATAGDARATVAFTVGGAGDAAITGYEASVDGGAWTALTGTTSPLAVTGLTNGRSHAIRLRALSAVGAGAASAAVAVTPTVAAGTLKRTRFTALAGARVRVRATVTGPGRVVVTGTRVGATARAKARPLCTARATVKKAGTVTLLCTLNRAARAQLTRGPLRLRITAVYTPTGGTATTMAQVMTLPRTARG